MDSRHVCQAKNRLGEKFGTYDLFCNPLYKEARYWFEKSQHADCVIMKSNKDI